jgi:hypothetical protein
VPTARPVSDKEREGFTQILFGGDRPLAGARSESAGNGAPAGRETGSFPVKGLGA